MLLIYETKFTVGRSKVIVCTAGKRRDHWSGGAEFLPVMLILVLVLVLKDSLWTKFKSLSLSL